MPPIKPSKVYEAQEAEDAGYLFRRLGEICFTTAAEEVQQSTLDRGNTRRLAVSARRGVTFFADSQGVYAARTARLLASSVKGTEEEELPAVPAADMAAWDLPEGTELRQFEWRPPSSGLPTGALCTQGGQLLVGKLGAPLKPAPFGSGDVSTLAWSHSGALLALGHGAQVTVLDFSSGQKFSSVIPNQEADGAVQVDTLTWVGPSAVLVAVTELLEDGQEEGDQAPLALLEWTRWDATSKAAPEGLQLASFFPQPVVPEAAASGPYLHAVYLPAWGVVLAAHRKANDEHIRLLEVGNPGSAQSVAVTDEATAIRIPFAMDDADNFVVGLGLDLTSSQVEVPHVSPEHGSLPPAPLLLVATSDGVLRLFTFGSVRRDMRGLVQAPLPLLPPPPGMPGQAAPPVSSEADQMTAAAVKASLPSDDEEDESEGGEEAAEQARAAATALPSEDDLSEEDEEMVTAKPQQQDKAPASTSMRKDGTLTTTTPAAQQAAAAHKTSETVQQPLGFGMPAISHCATAEVAGVGLFGATSGPAAFSWAKPPPSTAGFQAPGPFGPPRLGLFPPATAAQPAHAVLPQPRQPDSQTSHPGLPVGRGEAQARAAQAAARRQAQAASPGSSLPTSRQASADLDAGQAGESRTGQTASSSQQPPPLATPQSYLQGVSQEAAAMETDFLKSLSETRGLESRSAHVGNQVRQLSQGQDQLRAAIAAQAEQSRRAADALQQAGEQFDVLKQAWKDDKQRVEALRFFQRGETGSGSYPAPQAVLAAAPLEPALAALRVSLAQQTQDLRSKTDDLQEVLQVLEQRSQAGGAALRSTSQDLYKAVNAQTAVARLQVERVEALMESLRDAGLTPALDSGSESEEGEAWGRRSTPTRPTVSACTKPQVFKPVPTGSAWKRAQARATPRMPAWQGMHSPGMESKAGSTDCPSPWQRPGAADLRLRILTKAAGARPPKIRAAAPTAKQLPIPSMAQVAAANQRLAEVTKPPASPSAAAPPAPPPAPSPAVRPAPAPALPTTKPLLPTAKPPPIPSRSQVAAAQAHHAQVLGPRPAQPPAPASTASSSSSQPSAAGSSAGKEAGRPVQAKQPPIPTRSQMAAAQALQARVMGAGGASSSSASSTSSATTASAPTFGLAPAVPPPTVTTSQPAASTSASSAASAVPAVNAALPASFPAFSFSNPQSAGASFGTSLFGNSSAPAPATSSAPVTVGTSSQLAAVPAFSFAGFGASTAPASQAPALPSFASLTGGAASSAAPVPSPTPGIFGAPAASSSAPPSGAPVAGAFGSTAPQTPPVGAFSGFGLTTSSAASMPPAPAAASSPFGKGLGFGSTLASTPGTLAPFGSSTGFGTPPPQQAAQAPFASQSQPAGGGFGASLPQASVFGQAGGGFGQPSALGFGQAASPGFGATAGQPGFGQAASPGFGQAASPGFGQAAMPGFGMGATPGFGSSSGFGSASQPTGFAAAASPGGGFAAAAQQGGGGFGALASQQPSGFGGGGFAAAQNAGGGFGALAAGGSPLGSATPASSAMWQPRK
ncbi:hypothetical protein WJX72_002240 [[Myrmecia] bisecta]|uniref:Nuclear pore complex protein n=1 Tax=[Myrmecia] bisecta TaxID=41462 RepID=A0AAW1Q3J0_9CHLO